MIAMLRLAGLLCAAALLAACGSDTMDGEAGDFASEPALETEVALLDAGLDCTPFENPDKPPVLLVHGTFTHGQEQYNWTYKPLLIARGFDVCTVTYPDRGFGDMQISAEYVVHALRRIRAESGRKVAVIGHSQGVAVPRWAIKWWPSARNAVEDFVMQAGPNHGADPVALFTLLGLVLPVDVSPANSPLPLPASFRQLIGNSEHMQAVNRDDETPGDIDYTALYTVFDELVQPVYPVPTAAVDYGLDNPKVSNILLQDVCPGLIVDHVTIGLTDRVAFELTLDAITHPGPANVERAGGAGLCNLLPLLPSQAIAPDLLVQLLGLLPIEIANGAPGLHLATREPPLKPYVR
jgi:triacylglycerol lipase